MTTTIFRIVPLTTEEIEFAMHTNGGHVCEKVLVELDDVIDREGVDGFNDLLEGRLLGEESNHILSDIEYSVVGTYAGSIIIEVDACLESCLGDEG
jgi:hypothetical protein